MDAWCRDRAQGEAVALEAVALGGEGHRLTGAERSYLPAEYARRPRSWWSRWR